MSETIESLGRWNAVADRSSDRLNAILIRETRRALNGKLFVITFIILVAICVLASMVIGWTNESDGLMGWRAFQTLFLCFCGIAFLGVPYIVASMVQAEIRDRTFELLCITTITPARIIWGELWTAAGLLFLLSSAMIPFMAFSYLLGGVDIRSIVTGMAYVFLVSLFLTLVGIVGAVVPGRAILGYLFMIVLAVIAWSMAMGLVVDDVIAELWEDPNAHWVVLAILGSFLSVGGILFTVGMARMSFPAANKSGPIRAAVLAHVAVIVTIAWFIREMEAWIGFNIYLNCVLFLLGMAVAGESEELSDRQLRKGALTRHLATIWSLFLPGNSRGTAFVLLSGLALTLATTVGLQFVSVRSWLSTDVLQALPWTMFSYLALYLVAADFLALIFPPPWRTPLVRRVVVLVVFATSLMVPLLAAVSLGSDVFDSYVLAAFHPILLLARMLDRPSSGRWEVVVLAVFCVAMIALAFKMPSMIRGILAGRRSSNLPRGARARELAP